MADNYLEKKFEEYSIRKSTAKTKKIVSTGPKPEHIEVRFPTRRVFVTGGAKRNRKSHRTGIPQDRLSGRILR